MKKLEKKYLTKSFESDIILKLLQKRDSEPQKKFEKLLKKELTNERKCGIIKKLTNE